MPPPGMTQSTRNTESDASAVPLWQPILLAALAGGMGWGIRGQYGHETGAMIAGLLVSLTLVFLFCPRAALLPSARAIAMGTIAIGFGGSMTYGQTIGLTHDAPLIGNWAALRWGMLGLAIKGGIWIGFAGLFLGMGLGGVRYRAREILLLMLAMLALYALGVWALNRPFDPANKVLPKIYFSHDWRWQPGAELKPRRECWGGLLFALLGAWAWASAIRRDRLARSLAFWGIVGGALGFPLGQSLQAFHAWNPELYKTGLWLRLDPFMNWWNWMETTFGGIMGACLGLGLWLNRRLIALPEIRSRRGREALASMTNAATANNSTEGSHETFSPPIEWLLVGLHVTLLTLAEFASVRSVSALYDLGLVLALIPMVAVAGGRWWPFLLPLPITLLPIAGKTIRQLGYREHTIGLVPGWLLYGVLPLALTTVAALWFASRTREELSGGEFARRSLLICTWLYFGLNCAFFHFPWPWTAWTGRTPNGLAFTLCAFALTLAAILISRKGSRAGC